METRHVKLDYETSLSSKKQLLSAELNLLQIIRKIKAYNFLRKREFAAKKEFKKTISSLKSRVNSVEATFPEQDLKKKKMSKVIKKIRKKERSNLKNELDEIKKKLERLG